MPQIIKKLVVVTLWLLVSNVQAIGYAPNVTPASPSSQNCIATSTASCGTTQPQIVQASGKPTWCSNGELTQVESMICATPSLWQLDNNLNRLVAQNSEGAAGIGADRRSRRDTATTPQAIAAWYNEWLTKLAMGGQPATPIAQSYQTVTQYQSPPPPPSYQPQPIQQFQQPQSAQGGQPSWCSAAATQVEQMICGNPELSALDNQLNNLFAQNSSAGKGIGKSRRNERDRATTAQAVAAWYRKWIAKLSQ